MADSIHSQFSGSRRPARRPRQIGPVVTSPVATNPINVLFTSADETIGAVRVARRLAQALGSRVTVVHFRPVPVGAPLESPNGLSPAETDAFRARLEGEGAGAEVRVCVCRDPRDILSRVFPPHSLVVIGRRRHWWGSPADRWRRTLEAAGHRVVVVDEVARA